MKYRELKSFLDNLNEDQLDQTLTLFVLDHTTTTHVTIAVLEDDLINPNGEGLELREAYNDPDDEDSMEYYHYASAVYPKGTVCLYADNEPREDSI